MEASKSNQTRCVKISNLRRPLRVEALKELISATAEIEYFWIDDIKSHCYIETHSSCEASATLSALNSFTWPPETGAPLKVELVSEAECKQHGD